ncbi:hypothetical protein [Candidatus Poriferisodalis sp.]|uniref:hypothetical protein n=1 Tax=Candidatus Poriferisodalis sp. TaxID=3101277 RepID=UPI003B011201
MTIKNHGLLDDEAVAWLSTIDTSQLTDRQRLGLAFLHRNRTVTNQQYRSLTGCDAQTATRELAGLASAELVHKTNDRRWTIWVLRDDFGRMAQPRSDFGAETPRTRRDRRPEIRALLASRAQPTRALAEELEMSGAGVLRWLRKRGGTADRP